MSNSFVFIWMIDSKHSEKTQILFWNDTYSLLHFALAILLLSYLLFGHVNPTYQILCIQISTSWPRSHDFHSPLMKLKSVLSCPSFRYVRCPLSMLIYLFFVMCRTTCETIEIVWFTGKHGTPISLHIWPAIQYSRYIIINLPKHKLLSTWAIILFAPKIDRTTPTTKTSQNQNLRPSKCFPEIPFIHHLSFLSHI